MKTYRITVNTGGAAAGISGPKDGSYTLSATSPAVALKRLLDGGHAAGFKFATVGGEDQRLQLARGQRASILIERIA